MPNGDLMCDLENYFSLQNYIFFELLPFNLTITRERKG